MNNFDQFVRENGFAVMPIDGILFFQDTTVPKLFSVPEQPFATYERFSVTDWSTFALSSIRGFFTRLLFRTLTQLKVTLIEY